MTAGEISPEWEAAGLYDPKAEKADEQYDLFVFFDEVGYTPADFAGLGATDNLVGHANKSASRPGRRVSRAEAIELSGGWLHPALRRDGSR